MTIKFDLLRNNVPLRDTQYRTNSRSLSEDRLLVTYSIKRRKIFLYTKKVSKPYINPKILFLSSNKIKERLVYPVTGSGLIICYEGRSD